MARRKSGRKGEDEDEDDQLWGELSLAVFLTLLQDYQW